MADCSSARRSKKPGFDKRTDPATIQSLYHAALELIPKLRDARILEDWAGLRPGTPDGLPILGATSTPGYFVATGHFRDGILLAPITAHVMAQVIERRKAHARSFRIFAPPLFAKPKTAVILTSAKALGGTLRQRAGPVRLTRSTKLPTAQTAPFDGIATLIPRKVPRPAIAGLRMTIQNRCQSKSPNQGPRTSSR